MLENDVEQRQYALVQPDLAQLAQAGAGVPGKQQLQHLVEQARRRHALEERSQLADRRARCRVEREAQLRREPHGPQHAYRIFPVPSFRIADHAQHAPFQIGQAAVEIHQLFGLRIEVQRIDGEIAPPRILFLRAEDVVAQYAPVLVRFGRFRVSSAESRDFDCLGAQHHVHQPEAAADDDGAAKQRPHLLRARVGRDVEVLGSDAEKQVADGAADHVTGKTGSAQRRADLRCSRADGVPREVMLAARYADLRGQPQHAPY